MKKLLFALCVLFSIVSAVAFANTIETEHFIIDLPDHWYSNPTYYTDGTNAQLRVQEIDMSGYTEKDMDSLGALLTDYLCDNYVTNTRYYLGDLRILTREITGKKAPMFVYTSIRFGIKYDAFVAFTWCDGSILRIQFDDYVRSNLMEFFEGILSGVSRKAADAEEAEEPVSFTVFDQDGIQVLFSDFDIEPGTGWLAVDVTVMNGSGRDLRYSFWDVYINNWLCDSSIGEKVKAGRNSISTEHWLGMNRIGVSKVTDIQSMELTLRLEDAATHEALYEHPVTITFTP